MSSASNANPDVQLYYGLLTSLYGTKMIEKVVIIRYKEDPMLTKYLLSCWRISNLTSSLHAFTALCCDDITYGVNWGESQAWGAENRHTKEVEGATCPAGNRGSHGVGGRARTVLPS